MPTIYSYIRLIKEQAWEVTKTITRAEKHCNHATLQSQRTFNEKNHLTD